VPGHSPRSRTTCDDGDREADPADRGDHAAFRASARALLAAEGFEVIGEARTESRRCGPSSCLESTAGMRLPTAPSSE
jgi:hypothetical protein